MLEKFKQMRQACKIVQHTQKTHTNRTSPLELLSIRHENKTINEDIGWKSLKYKLKFCKNVL